MNGPEQNGKPEVGEAVQKILAASKASKESLLLDMEQDFPQLRELLLGGAPGSGSAPAATLMISRSASGVSVRLTIAALGVQAAFDCKSLFGTLEMIELELSQGTLPWQATWQREKRERSAWDGLV